MNTPDKPFFLQALDALKTGDRRGAAALLGRQLHEGNTAAKNLGPVRQLAEHIGEVGLAVEAARQGVAPGEINSLINYWSALANFGRSGEALADIERQPAGIRDHPSVLHVRGTIATQFGRFQDAHDLFRRALSKSPAAMPTWFALAMIKTFMAGDPDIGAMERLERRPGGAPDARAALCYALGKACEDVGHSNRAFDFYARGAALRRQELGQVDTRQLAAAADQVVRDVTPENLGRLVPSGASEQRSLFVTGLPRSGTTLTEQILLGHSAVDDGAELNISGPALMPARGTIAGALAYQQSAAGADPWGEIGRDYANLVGLRFRTSKLVVDKSLGQGLLIGLMLHALPNARIAWLRRNPDDIALSCFRTYFTSGLSWTWSLRDIADVMKTEDRLFEHWRSVFPERILAVPYEELVGAPAAWTAKLQAHFGLSPEAATEDSTRSSRAISTASVAQVGQPISTSRIGQAAGFERQMQPFRDAYYG